MSTKKGQQYGIESYFRNLCNSYYIAYQILKQLKEEKKELEGTISEEYKQRDSEIAYQQYFWSKRLEKMGQEIKNLIREINQEGISFVVTNEAEVIVLISFYQYSTVKSYRIVNTKKKHWKAFKDNKKMYKKFLDAYKSKSDDLITELYHKYF